MKQKNKAKRLKKQKRSFLSPLYTSLFSILLCMVCLAGTTWAWFTSNQEVVVESIASAQWKLQSLEVYEVVTGNDIAVQTDSNVSATQNKISVTEENGVWSFSASANTQYVVSASVNGTANNGFLLINTCDGCFYTEDTHSSFSLLLSEECMVQISASWGSDYGNASQFTDGDTLGSGKVAEPEIDKCSCTEKCVDSGNPECVVCKNDIEGCNGKEPETIEDTTTESNELTITEEPPTTTEPSSTTGSAITSESESTTESVATDSDASEMPESETDETELTETSPAIESEESETTASPASDVEMTSESSADADETKETVNEDSVELAETEETTE